MMGKRRLQAIAVFALVPFSIYAKGVGKMRTIEESYFDSSGLYIVFATAERFDSLRGIEMYSWVAKGDDVGKVVFSVSYEEFEILDSTIFIPIEVLRKHATRTSGEPSYYPFLSNQQYELSFDVPGIIHNAEISIESPIRDATVNLLEAPIADKANTQIVSQRNIYKFF